MEYGYLACALLFSCTLSYCFHCCRYMVLLRMGGVYADVDVECQQPLDELIQPTDTLIVGWEQEVPSVRAAAAGSYNTGSSVQQLARTRQVLQWFFAAAPGHPVLREMCDHIARNAMITFSHNSVRDTQERTGPGIWTDVVLKHAMQHPVTKVGCGVHAQRG